MSLYQTVDDRTWRELGGRSIPVLCVDDDPDYQRLLEMWLGQSIAPYFTFESATGLLAAAQCMSVHPCEAILLDLGLVGSKGLDTLEAARVLAPHVPIVVLTATDDPAVAARAIEAGAAEYLAKEDVGPEELTDALFEAVSAARTWSVPALPISCRTITCPPAFHAANDGMSVQGRRWLQRMDWRGFPTDKRNWS